MKTTASIACPICASTLIGSGRSYAIEELFAMWQPVRFTPATLDEHKLQGGHTRLYVCPGCELGIFYPQIIATPAFYGALQEGTSNSYYAGEKWDFREALRDAKNTAAIIEIGCGPGVFLDQARRHAAQAVGIETNPQALAAARGKGLRVCDRADGLAEFKGRFDIAFCFHVLEHVPDPVGFIREMLAWVGPQGKIGISVPNMDGPIRHVVPCVSNMPPHHASRWKLKTFEALAARLELVIERVAFEPLIARDHYYYSSYWVMNSLPARLLPRQWLPVLQRATAGFFASLFKLLAKFNKKEFALLKGQSMYVLLARREGKKT